MDCASATVHKNLSERLKFWILQFQILHTFDTQLALNDLTTCNMQISFFNL